MYLSSNGVLVSNEALADDLSNEASRILIYSPISSDKSLFSNIILAQTDKTEKDINTKDNQSEKIPSALTVGYSAWYAQMTLSDSGAGASGKVSLGLHGPSLSYSFGKWSLSGSFLLPMTKATVDADTYGTGNGTMNSYMHTEFDRYDGDIILRRSFGMGNWMFGPQLGIKYMGIKNYNATVKNEEVDMSSTIYTGKGNMDAYGPSLGVVIAYIPGNPETSPITFSLVANALYLKLTGEEPNSPLYSTRLNMSNAGYDPNGTYYGLDLGSVPLHKIDTWIPGYNASFQMTYNLFAGLNATVGARYNYAKNKEEYYQSGLPGEPGSIVPSLTWFEYWGAFANIAYSF